MKKCRECKSEVGRSNTSGVCRPCYIKAYYSIEENWRRKNERAKAWAKSNPERHRQKSLDWQKNNPDRVRRIREKTMSGDRNRFTRAIWGAKRRGHEWALDRDTFLALRKRPCEYCGGALDKLGSGLDRLDSKQGYTPDNVVPCCGTCNRIKGANLTYKEMTAAMRAVLDVRRGANG